MRAQYKGSITTTGRSEAVRLDKALFKAHPEFRQRAKVTAHVLAPGSLLFTPDEDPSEVPDDIERDPVFLAYPDFLERDMIEHPERIEDFTEADMARMRELTKGVVASDDDIIPDDVTF